MERDRGYGCPIETFSTDITGQFVGGDDDEGAARNRSGNRHPDQPGGLLKNAR